MRKRTSPLPFSPLNRHEVRNAVHLALFRQEIDLAKRIAALSQIEADIRDGILAPIFVSWSDVYQQAEKLADLHSAIFGCRGIDILHIATAVTLGANEFLTFDRRQRQLAEAADLTVRL